MKSKALKILLALLTVTFLVGLLTSCTGTKDILGIQVPVKEFGISLESASREITLNEGDDIYYKSSFYGSAKEDELILFGQVENGKVEKDVHLSQGIHVIRFFTKVSNPDSCQFINPIGINIKITEDGETKTIPLEHYVLISSTEKVEIGIDDEIEMSISWGYATTFEVTGKLTIDNLGPNNLIDLEIKWTGIPDSIYWNGNLVQASDSLLNALNLKEEVEQNEDVYIQNTFGSFYFNPIRKIIDGDELEIFSKNTKAILSDTSHFILKLPRLNGDDLTKGIFVKTDYGECELRNIANIKVKNSLGNPESLSVFIFKLSNGVPSNILDIDSRIGIDATIGL